MMAAEELAIDSFHFNKKLKMEQTIHERVEAGELVSPINCVFDDTETFVLYGCMLGVKVMNVRMDGHSKM